jgi:hypothetical protein
VREELWVGVFCLPEGKLFPWFIFRSSKTKVLHLASSCVHKHGKRSHKTFSRLAKPGAASLKGIAGYLARCGVESGVAWSS